MHPNPTVALIGMHLEANAFAPPTTEANFRASCYLEGEAILAEAANPAPAMPLEVPAFIQAMDASGPWRPVPVLLAAVEPGGPVVADFFERMLETVREKLPATVDAVYISNHGAMTSTEDPDPDGALYATVREIVGPSVPIVATVDLHANISDRMVSSVEAIIAYRTNPHVDQRERAGDAAMLLRRLLGGLRLRKCFVRLPIVAPSVRLLTAEGPYADLVEAGARLVDDALPVVSVVGGFAWSDTPKNGLAILTYGDAAVSENRPERVAADLAARAWADRERYRVVLTSLDDAVAEAVSVGRNRDAPALCLADVADNPGGGGRGNTTDLLEALLAAEPADVLLGLFVDAALADACHAAGAGAEIDATLNSVAPDRDGRRIEIRAEVLAVSDGDVIGRRGIVQGRLVRLGRSAAIRCSGITIAVVSRRVQAADPAFFESLGLDIARFRTVVLKSRGHFRAGFDEFFRPDRILEVDAGGLVSPILSRFPFRHLPRPVYPLDPETAWPTPVAASPKGS